MACTHLFCLSEPQRPLKKLRKRLLERGAYIVPKTGELVPPNVGVLGALKPGALESNAGARRSACGIKGGLTRFTKKKG